MKNITILVPTVTSPSILEKNQSRIFLIIDELKKKAKINLIFVSFKPQIDKTETKFNIINFNQKNNAVSILNDLKPDCVLSDAALEFSTLPIIIASKFLKIPVFTMFLRDEKFEPEKINEKINETKMVLRLLSKNPLVTDNKNEIVKEKSYLKFLLEEFRFLIRTYRKTEKNIFQTVRFGIFFLWKRAFAYYPIHKITEGDLNFCSNYLWKEYLFRKGFSKPKIIEVGSPFYDSIYQQVIQQKVKPIGKKIRILLCTTPIYEHGKMSKKHHDKLLIKTINKILENDNIEVTLKIHPTHSDIKEYQFLAKSFKKGVKIFQRENIIDLLFKHDIMISYGTSRVLITGVLSKKPILNLQYIFQQEQSPFFDSEIMTGCYNIDELNQKIKEVASKKIDENSYEDYINKFLGKFDGKCSLRIAESILNKFQVR